MRKAMTTIKYSMAFSSGALLHRESVEIVLKYCSLLDWNLTKAEVINNNLLQFRTKSTLQRIYNEVATRLHCLSYAEMVYFSRAYQNEQGYLLWLAICRRYKFIGEFAEEVLRDRFLSMKHTLAIEDYDTFFNAKAEWCSELDALTPATQKKLRQVLFRMLHEANLLSRDNTIIPAVLTPHLKSILGRGVEGEFKWFPVHVAE